jgi:uncharacterized protein YraI
MRAPSCLRLCFGVYLLALSAAAATQNAVTTAPVDVYAGPDDSYPMVAQLDADEPVQVMGCLDDWSWCDVVFADNRGWLYAPDITYNYEGGYVPFYTYAPSFGVPIEQFTIGDYWDRYYHGRPWYGQREEWEHRELSHRRPSGPPPSAGPPPRSARVDRPSHEGQPERPLRLGRAAGSAEPPHREAERRGGARDGAAGGVRPPDVRSPDAQRPDGRPPDVRSPSAQRPDGRPPDVRSPDVSRPDARSPDGRPPEARSAEHERVAPPPQGEHPGHTEPPRQGERALPPRADGARHDEQRRGDKPGERPND